MIHKRSTPWNGQNFFTGGLKLVSYPLIQMCIKTNKCLVRIKDPKLIDGSSPSTFKYKSRHKKRLSKDKEATVYTTEYPSKIYLTVTKNVNPEICKQQCFSILMHGVIISIILDFDNIEVFNIRY